jgi:hypothetical protein
MCKIQEFICLLILLSMLGCDNPDRAFKKYKAEKPIQESIDINDQINQNKDNLLFHSFWKGMSQDEFEKVKAYETQLGKLEKGRYIFYMSENKEIPFEIYKKENTILLKYRDDISIDFESSKLYRKDSDQYWGVIRGYENIENSILNILNNKYDPIQEDDIVSIIGITVPEIKKEKSSLDRLYDKIGDEMGISTKTSHYWVTPEENKKVIFLTCLKEVKGSEHCVIHTSGKTQISRIEITIEYSSFDDFIVKERKLRTKAREKVLQENKDGFEKKKFIDKNNRSL